MSKKLYILKEGHLDQLVEKLTKKIVSIQQNQMSDSEELLDVNEASQLIKLTKPTLYGLVHRNKIPYYKKGKKLYFYKSELLEWINSGRTASKDDLESLASKYILNNSGY